MEDNWECQINYSVLNEFFGDNVRPVMQLLSGDFDYPEFAGYKYGQARAVISQLKQAAKQWLLDNPEEQIISA